MWCEIFDNRNNKPILLKLLREITTGFVGITDSPASMFIPELLEIYPDAKVVLNTRDPERWYKSMEAVTNNALINRTVLQTLLLPIPTWRWIPVWIYQMGDKFVKTTLSEIATCLTRCLGRTSDLARCP